MQISYFFMCTLRISLDLNFKTLVLLWETLTFLSSELPIIAMLESFQSYCLGFTRPLMISIEQCCRSMKNVFLGTEWLIAASSSYSFNMHMMWSLTILFHLPLKSERWLVHRQTCVLTLVKLYCYRSAITLYPLFSITVCVLNFLF